MKHMKKMISVLLCIAVLICVFTGCTGTYVASKTVGESAKTAAIEFFKKQLTVDYPGYYLCALNAGTLQISDVDTCTNDGDVWTVAGTLLAASKAEPVNFIMADYTIVMGFIGYVDQTSDTFELKEYKLENRREVTKDDVLEMSVLAYVKTAKLETEDGSALTLATDENGKPQVTIDSVSTADEQNWEATMTIVANSAEGASYSCQYKLTLGSKGAVRQNAYSFNPPIFEQTGTWMAK